MRSGSDRSGRRSHPGARLRNAVVTLASAAALLAAGATAAAAAAPVQPRAGRHRRAPAQHTQRAGAAARFRHACATPSKKLTMQCMVLINTAVAEQPASAFATPAATPAVTPAGYGPSQLQSAYSIAAAAAANGSGETVYIVDAYDYPTAQADLNTYRSQYGLPACASGCFTKVNQNGCDLPAASRGRHYRLGRGGGAGHRHGVGDLPAVPHHPGRSQQRQCNPLYTAENSAVALGAKFISNSWGGSEYSGEASDANTYFNHPGVAITVSAGDSPGPEFPAEAEYVTAVGGTTLSTASNSRGWSESPWSDSGGGCSVYETRPSWQSSIGDRLQQARGQRRVGRRGPEHRGGHLQQLQPARLAGGGRHV